MNFFAASGDFAFDNPVSEACLTALNSTLTCASQFTSYPSSDYQGPFTSTELDGFCSSDCTSSLAQYRSSVSSNCKDDQPFNDIPTTFLGDRMDAYQNRTCMKDKSSGEYCNSKSGSWLTSRLLPSDRAGSNMSPVVNGNWTSDLPDQDFALADLRKENLCSDCFLSLLQAIQSTPYSNYDESFVAQYQDAQKGQKFRRMLGC